MKTFKLIIIFLIVAILFVGTSCNHTPDNDTGKQTTSHDIYADGFGEIPVYGEKTDRFDHPIFMDESVKHTDMTIDEKLAFLTDLENKDIVSAFVFWNFDSWQSCTIDINSSPTTLQKIIQLYTSTSSGIEIFDSTSVDIDEYESYIIFTTSDGTSFTLFNRNYYLDTDIIKGHFSNGDLWYESIPCVLVCFDGDYFLVKDVEFWQSLVLLNLPPSERYIP